MSVKTCKFIREATGKECEAVALKGTDRCYHHQAEKLRRNYLNTLRNKGGEPLVMEAFDLPPLDSLEDIQIALSSLFHVVANRRILEEDARLLLSILRVASRNLHVPRFAAPKTPESTDPEITWRFKSEAEMSHEEMQAYLRAINYCGMKDEIHESSKA